MFGNLFAEGGLSLDRLRSLLEVGAAGSIAKAACEDPVRQSQYSRQIKELEDFFRVRLVERHGRGTRLTASGRELARISRFFMLGLANFKRGCLAAEQRFRIGASATFLRQFLLPILSGSASQPRDSRPRPASEDNMEIAPVYITEVVPDEEIERRLHDLTLDFGVIGDRELSRPLQSAEICKWNLLLWVPRTLRMGEAAAARAFMERRLAVVLARKEMNAFAALSRFEYPERVACDSFVDASVLASDQGLSLLLPDFLAPGAGFARVRVPDLAKNVYGFCLAWNPRLLRLNPHMVRKRDWLARVLRQTQSSARLKS